MSLTNNHDGTILIVDDTPSNLSIVSSLLEKAGLKVLVAENGKDARKITLDTHPDLILLDVLMPVQDGYETCLNLKANPNTKDIPVIFMTALSDPVDKVKGFNVGGVDYITKPFNQEEVLARVKTHLTLRKLYCRLESQNSELEEKNQLLQSEIDAHTRTKGTMQYLQDEIEAQQMGGGIIGQSSAIRKTVNLVMQAAETDCTVLIIGETGTGKEMLARTVHEQSMRAHMPMIKVNCASIPKDLFESEFFGHEKGSFTGATTKRIGRFELANGGTLFLDEIGELPLDIQAKLLRVLQEQEFERIGGTCTQKVDVRIIAATNRDLQEEVQHKRFREDLYYRLNVFPVPIPPLRERQEDIPLLVEHIVNKFSVKHGKIVHTIHPHSRHEFMNYSWPGNIRELENVIERAVIVSKGHILEVGNWLAKQSAAFEKNESSPTEMKTHSILSLEEAERLQILHALDMTKWRVSGEKGAAHLLGINRSTLRSRMEKLGITRDRQPVSV